MLVSRMLALDTTVSDHVVMVMFAYQSGSSRLKSCQCVHLGGTTTVFYQEPITYVIALSITEL